MVVGVAERKAHAQLCDGSDVGRGHGPAGGGGPEDFGLAKFSPVGKLLAATYLGENGDEMARACCVGPDGTLYAGGVTTSRDFPVQNAFQDQYGGDPGFGSVPNGGQFPVGWGDGDCWVAKLQVIKDSGTATK